MYRQLASALVAASVTAGAPAAASLVAPDGTYNVEAAYAQASADAPCHPDPRDLSAIQQKESPSAVVDPSGRVTTPEGQPIVGDGGDSLGPFQFNVPAGTWDRYGNGGDPNQLLDAAEATARMLCANNYAQDRIAAIARHNGSGPAARAYAADVDAIAKGVPVIAPVPPSPTGAAQDAAGDGCTAAPSEGRYTLGATANRLWCNTAIKVWRTVSQAPGNGPEWVKADRWLFGEPATAPPGPPAPDAVVSGRDGVVCPVTAGLEVGDGWGAPRTGHSHQGIDLFGTFGSSAVSPLTGTVVDANGDEGAGGLGGRSVTVRAEGGRYDGSEVYLAHLEAVAVSAGQHVTAGEPIGSTGNSGNARGGDAHVHAQWYDPGGAVVPAGPTLGAACGSDPDGPAT